MSTSILSELVRLARTIIDLAIDTADDRTRHLTDHIYHVVTFSALTLTQIIYSYESKLRATKHQVVDLDNLVLKLVSWLKSIGLTCHISHLLSDIVLSQFEKLRPGSRPMILQVDNLQRDKDSMPDIGLEAYAGQSETGFPDLDIMSSELFGIDSNVALWPEWDQISPQIDP